MSILQADKEQFEIVKAITVSTIKKGTLRRKHMQY